MMKFYLWRKGIGKGEKAVLDASFNEYKNSIKKEFEYLYLAGRKSLTAMRSKDSFSMKKESEDKGAEVEAEKRIGEIQKSLKEASDTLEKNLTLMKSLNTEEVGVRINEWEDDFKKSFEKGLRKWEEAEKDFLSERIRWEEYGREGYLKAENEWDRAIEKFTEARRSWSVEMKGIIDEGRTYWQKREVSFFESYREVTEGMEEASLKEKMRFEKELTGYLSVYRESRNIEGLAKENIEYLTEEIARIERYKADKQRTVSRVKNRIDDIEDDINDYERYIKRAVDEIENDDDRRGFDFRFLFIRIYRQKIDDLKPLLPPLYNQYNLAVEIRDRKNSELSSYRTELAFWENASVNYKTAREAAENSLISLEEQIKSGVYGGNEFDSELNILKEKRDILKRKLDIAQHVYEYSLDNTSDRREKQIQKRNTVKHFLFSGEKRLNMKKVLPNLMTLLKIFWAKMKKILKIRKTSLVLLKKSLKMRGLNMRLQWRSSGLRILVYSRQQYQILKMKMRISLMRNLTAYGATTFFIWKSF